jgi:hypothetical protein
VVYRRYEHFRALRSQVGAAFRRAPEFPRRTLAPCIAQDQLDLRRCRLERWMQALVRRSWTDVRLASAVYAFLESPRSAAQPVGGDVHNYAPPAAMPQQGTAAMPQGGMWRVRIPERTVPGTVMQVSGPQGDPLTFIVPPGGYELVDVPINAAGVQSEVQDAVQDPAKSC